MSLDWLSKVDFDTKSPPLSSDELVVARSILSMPLTEEEISELENLCKPLGQIAYLDWDLPNYSLPEEFIALLRYSNGGNFANGEREIGLFSLADIRSYYLYYLFPEYQPEALPFGFNGGGIFYAYDFRGSAQHPPIIATASGCLDWEESVVLGHSLEEVFSKSSNIEHELG